jgi:hypothetical protein
MKSITIVLVFFLLSCKSVNNNNNKEIKQNRDSIYNKRDSIDNEYEAEKIKEYLDQEYNLYLEEIRENQEQEFESDPR